MHAWFLQTIWIGRNKLWEEWWTHLSALAFLLSSSWGSTLEAGANLASRAFFFASSSAVVVGLGIPNLWSRINNSVHLHSQWKINDSEIMSGKKKRKGGNEKWNLSALAFLFRSSDFDGSDPCDAETVPNLHVEKMLNWDTHKLLGHPNQHMNR